MKWRLLYSIKMLLIAIFLVFGNGLECERDSTIVYPPPVVKDSTLIFRGPIWSKDNKKILGLGTYSVNDGFGLFEVDSSGGVAQRLMQDSLDKDVAILSPDGNHIAYLAAEKERLLCCAHVWVMNIDGTNAHDLTQFTSSWEYLRWSPDSRYLIFDGGVDDSGVVNYQIVRVDVQTGELKFLTRGSYGNRDASYLTNGQKIVYLSGRIPADFGGKV